MSASTTAHHPYYGLLVSNAAFDANTVPDDASGSLVFAFFPKSAWFASYAKEYSSKHEILLTTEKTTSTNASSAPADFFALLPKAHPALYSEFAWRSLSALPAVRPGFDFAVLPDWPAVREYVDAFHSSLSKSSSVMFVDLPLPSSTAPSRGTPFFEKAWAHVVAQIDSHLMTNAASSESSAIYHLYPMFCEDALGELWDPRVTTFSDGVSKRIGSMIGDRENLDGKGRVRPVCCAEAKSWLQPPLELATCGGPQKIPRVGVAASMSTATTTAGCLSIIESSQGEAFQEGCGTESESPENNSNRGSPVISAERLTPLSSPASTLPANIATSEAEQCALGVVAPEEEEKPLTEKALRNHDKGSKLIVSEKQQLSSASVLATSPNSCYPSAVSSGTCIGNANPPNGFRCSGYAAVREAVRILTEVEKRDAILKLAKGRGGVGILPYVTLEKLEKDKMKFGFHDLEDDRRGEQLSGEIEDAALYIVEEMLAGVTSSPTLYMLGNIAMLPLAEQVFAPNSKTINVGNYFPARTRSILEGEQASCVAQAEDLQRYWHFQNVWNLDYVTTTSNSTIGEGFSRNSRSFVVDVNCGRVPGNLAARLFLARNYEKSAQQGSLTTLLPREYSHDVWNNYPICTLSMGVKTRADNMHALALATALQDADFQILNDTTDWGNGTTAKDGLLLLYYVPGDWLNATLVVGKSAGAGGWDEVDQMEKKFVALLSSLGFDVDADVEIITEM
ncbi:unnamed protein product [Amoebophrya sp. A25]|nr:unnamed protein product [Amoebophrya sp. A25]|eukprot:GSA25T00027372001.1